MMKQIYHCQLHPLQAANCYRNSRLAVDEDDLTWMTLLIIFALKPLGKEYSEMQNDAFFVRL